MLVKSLERLLSQSCNLSVDSLKVLLSFILVFRFNEFVSLAVAVGEPGKQEGKGWVLKEALLSLLRVLVHCVTDQSEVH